MISPLELRTTWDSAAPVITCARCYPDAAGWLKRRGLDPAAIERGDLARILPDPVRLGRELGTIPKWISCGWRSWARAAHCIAVPVFDEHGCAVALRTPSCGALDHRDPVPPLYSGAGAHANARGRALLLGEVIEGEVVIVDDLAEFLAWSLRDSVAALATWLGGWCQAFADRIPDGEVIVNRVRDEDLAEEVRASLVPRCRVLRARGQVVAA